MWLRSIAQLAGTKHHWTYPSCYFRGGLFRGNWTYMSTQSGVAFRVKWEGRNTTHDCWKGRSWFPVAMSQPPVTSKTCSACGHVLDDFAFPESICHILWLAFYDINFKCLQMGAANNGIYPWKTANRTIFKSTDPIPPQAQRVTPPYLWI